MKRGGRKWFAHEVVQTSAMDCGPAALKCLLEGFGVAVNYDRLREACQTDVDGTSIDTLEEIALDMGLDVEQQIIPAEHLLLEEANALPCIAVVRLPSGDTHFVIVWRAMGPLVEVMDPAIGRRWMTRDSLLADLYRHTMPFPVASWREWAAGAEFQAALARRLEKLGVDEVTLATFLDTALAKDDGWKSLADLDAVVRLADSLRHAGALKPGDPAEHLMRALLAEADRPATRALLEPYWHAKDTDQDDDEDQLLMRGAVIVRCTGLRADPVDLDELSPELAEARRAPPVRPLQLLWKLVMTEGWLPIAAVGLAAVTAAVALVLEALFFFSFLDIGERLVLTEQRVVIGVFLVAVVAGALAIEGTLASLLWRIGRHLELRMRSALLARIPRLSDRHFRSRLVSDMAQRAHLTYVIRELPNLGGNALRALLELVMTLGAIVWLEGGAVLWALTSLLLAFAVPALALPLLQGRDLKWRTHAGGLTRFHLDALLGLVPIRSHSAQDSFRRAHEGLLVEWARSAYALQRLSTAVDIVQWTAGLLMVMWIVSRHGGVSDFPAALLLLFWALKVPLLSRELAMVGRRYPNMHNVTLRLLEPLGSVEAATQSPAETAPAPPRAATATTPSERATEREPPRTEGVAIELKDVTVRLAGRDVIRNVNFRIAPGEHVAIVGGSGAGKSASLGLLLGWYPAASGDVLIDGEPLDAARLVRLRREIAWVDPAIQLWNRSLYDNLAYGADNAEALLDESLSRADLKGILQRMPHGLQTMLGDGGTLLSGGEGQRVRIGRAFSREAIRLVILDEPFRGLSRDDRTRLLERARARWPGATVLFVTHDLADSQSFDRVLVMHDGELAEDGSPAELAGADTRYAELLGMEEAGRAAFWGGEHWRRVRLDGGRLTETAGPT